MSLKVFTEAPSHLSLQGGGRLGMLLADLGDAALQGARLGPELLDGFLSDYALRSGTGGLGGSGDFAEMNGKLLTEECGR